MILHVMNHLKCKQWLRFSKPMYLFYLSFQVWNIIEWCMFKKYIIKNSTLLKKEKQQRLTSFALWQQGKWEILKICWRLYSIFTTREETWHTKRPKEWILHVALHVHLLMLQGNVAERVSACIFSFLECHLQIWHYLLCRLEKRMLSPHSALQPSFLLPWHGSAVESCHHLQNRIFPSM